MNSESNDKESLAGFIVLMSGSFAVALRYAQDYFPEDKEESRSPSKEYTRTWMTISPQGFFGRHAPAHLLVDRCGAGGRHTGPDEAYRFARGEEVSESSGLRVKLIRPLDFMVVADHAENLGLS